MARMTEIKGIKFNSVVYDANEWVLASEVAPYINEKSEDLKKRFDLICEALDGISNHDRIGLLGGVFGLILADYLSSDSKKNGGHGDG